MAYLREVVLGDRLGINASLEAQMHGLVDSFFDEWAEAVNTPALVARFRQFANTDEAADGAEVELDRGQTRPVFWPGSGGGDDDVDCRSLAAGWQQTSWEPVLPASTFAGADDAPGGVSAAVRRGDTQLAVWRFRGRYYATQQMCPHRRTFTLSDGLIGQDPAGGDDDGPWVSCPPAQAELRPRQRPLPERRGPERHRHLRRRGAAGRVGAPPAAARGRARRRPRHQEVDAQEGRCCRWRQQQQQQQQQRLWPARSQHQVHGQTRQEDGHDTTAHPTGCAAPEGDRH